MSGDIFSAFFEDNYTGESTCEISATNVPSTEPSLLVSTKSSPTVTVVSTKPTSKAPPQMNAAFSKLAKNAYDESGKPNYLDDTNQLIDGIYLGLPNNVYHSLDAYSSSHFKTYIQSPQHYEEKYLATVIKKVLRNPAFIVGDIAHELILEGVEIFSQRRFVLINPADYPNDLHSGSDLKAECERLKIKSTGTIQDKAKRIKEHGLNAKTYFDARQLKFIKDNVGDICFKEICNFLEDEVINLTTDAVLNVLLNSNVKSTPIKLPVLGDDYKEALALQKGLSRNKHAVKIFQNGIPEVTFIVTDPSTGLKLKCRTDWLAFIADTIIPADLKTTRSANPVLASYQFADLSYDLQAVFYLHVIKLSGLVTPERQFPFVAIEKGQFSICEVFELHESDWEDTETVLPKLLTHFKQFLTNRISTGYTKNGASVIKLAKRKNGFFLN